MNLAPVLPPKLRQSLGHPSCSSTGFPSQHLTSHPDSYSDFFSSTPFAVSFAPSVSFFMAIAAFFMTFLASPFALLNSSLCLEFCPEALFAYERKVRLYWSFRLPDFPSLLSFFQIFVASLAFSVLPDLAYLIVLSSPLPVKILFFCASTFLIVARGRLWVSARLLPPIFSCPCSLFPSDRKLSSLRRPLTGFSCEFLLPPSGQTTLSSSPFLHVALGSFRRPLPSTSL